MKDVNVNENFSILDLEYTAWPGSLERNWSGANEHREIIEIGVISINNLIEKKHLKVLVKPKINDKLSNYIQKLTGITNKLIVKEGVNFFDAWQILKQYFNENNKIYIYGNDDKVIYENLILNNLKDDFGALNFINIRPWIEDKLNINKDSINSSDLSDLLGIKNNNKHRAIEDCRSILEAIKFIKNSRRQFVK